MEERPCDFGFRLPEVVKEALGDLKRKMIGQETDLDRADRR